MSNPSLFIEDPERPCRYRIRPDVRLVTEEVIRGPIRWSRFVQGVYHQERGFLSAHAEERVPIAVLIYDDLSQRYIQCFDHNWIAEELNRIIVPSRATAIHYVPGICIDSIFTDLPIDTEETMPEQYKVTFPRPM